MVSIDCSLQWLARCEQERCPLRGAGSSHTAGCERPNVAIPCETNHFHLAGGARAPPFGDTPRADVLRKNSRYSVRQKQNVACIVPDAPRRFGGETLAPDGRVERVA